MDLTEFKNAHLCQSAQLVVITATYRAFFQAARELARDSPEAVAKLNNTEAYVTEFAVRMSPSHEYDEEENSNENITVGELLKMAANMYLDPETEIGAEGLVTALISVFALINNYRKDLIKW